LFKAKRGFLIVGFTGYTGAGCTTAASTLNSPSKLSLPLTKPANEISVGNYSERRFEKLKTIWGKIEWEPFTPIEVGAVIFAILAKQASGSRVKKGLISDINKLCKPHLKALEGLSALDVVTTNSRRLTADESKNLIISYQKCAELYGQYRYQKKRNGDLWTLISDMQMAGDKIRMFGKYKSGQPHPNHMHVIPEAVRKIISAYRRAHGKNMFTIDAFRNPYEVEYFRHRYEEFYLVAIFRDEEERNTLLNKAITDGQIKLLKEKENGDTPTDGKTKKQKPKINKDNIGWWVTGQNIPECTQKADVFIKNTKGATDWMQFSLIKTLSLINKPGCITPSNDEHYMQIASTARLMSGCLSRQVGACVVGSHGYIQGIGWNDTPQGQVPCALRSCGELMGTNSLAQNEKCASDNPFSEYEASPDFRKYISANRSHDAPFCFRTELANKEDKKSAEYTRALHAEENAFLQTAKVGGPSLQGAILYTTSSTCTLCAKKAYHLGVRRIVFIEKYPDKAESQTLKTGSSEIDIRYDQFEGISGSAFHKLYAPLMSEKDLIDYYN